MRLTHILTTLIGTVVFLSTQSISDDRLLLPLNFTAGCTVQMQSIATDVQIQQTRSWSVNDVLVYSFICHAINFKCADEPIPPQDTYDVVGNAVAFERSVNSTISFKSSTPELLSIKIVDTGDNPLSSTESSRVTVCGDQKNANPVSNSSCEFGHYNCEMDFQCNSRYHGKNITATCGCNGEWNDTIICSEIRCPINKCDDCCYAGDTDQNATEIGYNETVSVACCEGGPETAIFECTKQGEPFEAKLNCILPETTRPTTISEPTTISDAYVTSDSITGGNSTKIGMVTGDVSAEPVLVTGTINNNSSTVRGMSGGDIAGTTFTFIDVAAGIAVGVLAVMAYKPAVPLIITYAVAFPVCLAGILMCFLGSDGGGGSELNGVEKGGIGVATVGTVAAIGALVVQGVQGNGGKSAEKKDKGKTSASDGNGPGTNPEVYAVVDKSKKNSSATAGPQHSSVEDHGF